VTFAEGIEAFIRSSRVARLATVDAAGRPHIVPICYAYDGSRFFSAVDEKPKRVGPDMLRRLVNIRANPRICLILDEYDEDWSRLRFVIIHGTAGIEPAGADHKRAVNLLRKKYPQYRNMALAEGVNPVIAITPTKIVSWGRFE
jgi:PPOX class probable F420-dependent enzyme